mmetsp:Transcript_43120/g.101123  ORF Transcript_43120/g.101123 Transcript_43120/m.101123 type:complete len:389 (-) Transcript_43120:102-1268(-)
MTENNQFAWLGLLKWSLAYTDGTKPSDESMAPMSQEKRDFLEAVMRDGIIDEVQRMKEIVEQLRVGLSPKVESETVDTKESERPDEDNMYDLLMELRDIVEQIDYAHTFAKVGGVPFLLGCATEGSGQANDKDEGEGSPAQNLDVVPSKIREGCLSVLATISQNNPPVQSEIVSMGAIETLLDAYVSPPPADAAAVITYRCQIIRCLSCIVRGQKVGEDCLVNSEKGRAVLLSALTSPGGDLASTLRSRASFLVRALATSDDATFERIRQLRPQLEAMVGYVITNWDDGNAIPFNLQIQETSLETLMEVLRQKKDAHAVLLYRERLAGAGVARIAKLNQLHGDELELASTELELWESLILELAQRSHIVTSNNPEQLMMLGSEPNPNE